MKRYYVLCILILLFVMVVAPFSSVVLGNNLKSEQESSTNSQVSNEKSENQSKQTSETPQNVGDNQFLLFDEAKSQNISVNFLDYTILSTACEVYPSYHKEAIKAQAIACFTYAYRLDKLSENEETPILTVNSDKLLGYTTKERLKERWGDNFEAYYSKFEQAANEVYGMAITYENNPILAAYHAISPGITEDSATVWQQSLPYLKPVESKGDALAENYETKKSISPTDAETVLKTQYTDIKLDTDKNNWFKNNVKNSSLTVTSIDIGDKKLTGQEVRKIFDLKSASFDVKFENGNFTFTTKGYGHGVGLSQNGADFAARQGKTYKEILQTYYKDCNIDKII